MHGALHPCATLHAACLAKRLVKARAEGAQAVYGRRAGRKSLMIRVLERLLGMGWVWGFIVRDVCVDTGFRDTWVFVMEQVFICQWVTNRYGNRPT